jgi:hypothetical protein
MLMSGLPLLLAFLVSSITLYLSMILLIMYGPFHCVQRMKYYSVILIFMLMFKLSFSFLLLPFKLTTAVNLTIMRSVTIYLAMVSPCACPAHIIRCKTARPSASSAP